MPSNIMENRMFYSLNKPAWHSLGTVSSEPMGAFRVLTEHLGGGFETYLRPVTFLINGENQLDETGYAIVRGGTNQDPNEVKFGYCTENFHLLQPREVAECWDENVNLPVETMAFLGQGEDMFISTKMPSFEVVAGDPVDMYLIVRGGFDGMHGFSLFTATVRPVCWNTITLAQNWAKANTDGQGRGEIWTGKHVNHNLLRDLGYWMKHVVGYYEQESALVQGFFRKLAAMPVSNTEAQGLLEVVYPSKGNVDFWPSELRGSKDLDISSKNESQAEIRDGIYGLFAGAGTAITPDGWGLMNATSEYFCHVQPSKKPVASSVMFGNRAKNITRMVNTLKRQLVF
jgi:hypothetical protein